MDGKNCASIATDVIKNIQKEIGRLSNGPASFYFENVNVYVRALFDRFAPFKKGDSVVLIEDIPMTDKNPELHNCAHFLKKGEEAEVKGVDYIETYGKNGRFVAECVFHNETFKNRDGELEPITNKHLFTLAEKWLEKVEEE